ncbi:MAG: hypothetical protein UT33_C0009G0028 [Candidatus Peregrinibacteria bacterium GW2011_GWC2_39_14]|nr:MAG: hypothetical protein US92_C0005G0028 [Candidatus Peregrinibacteria bacterium GW2011_GWA2_38_36]KKR06577.1 MAG: hypothetical protein UT33_C0009G0028 [Candidatus Peregrinibacteria bacterium GW2011_GWC2_39_14]
MKTKSRSKSPLSPIILSAKSFGKLERMLRENDERTELNDFEKKLLEGSRRFDQNVKFIADEE